MKVWPAIVEAARMWASFEEVRLRSPKSLCMSIGLAPARLGRAADDWAGAADDWMENYGNSRLSDAIRQTGLDYDTAQPLFADACQKALSAEQERCSAWRKSPRRGRPAAKRGNGPRKTAKNRRLDTPKTMAEPPEE